MKNTILITLALILKFNFGFAQSWTKWEEGPGEQNNSAICTDLSGNVYVSDGMQVMKRSGGSWIPLGTGISYSGFGGGGVLAMCTDNTGNVYAIGDFWDDSVKGFVAKWNGSTWNHLGPVTGAINLNVGIVCVDPAGNVYAAGQAMGDTVFNIFKYNGTVWSKLGIGTAALNTKYGLNAICSDQSGNIYTGGFMSQNIGGTLYPYIAKWNGISWSALPAGNVSITPFGITSIITDSIGNVYATNLLKDTIATDSAGYTVDKWDGTSWTILGTGSHSFKTNGLVRSLCKDSHGNIYAAGQFNDTTGSTAWEYACVSKWNGTSWSVLGTGVNSLHPHNEIWAITSDIHDNIYAIGAITNDAGYGFVGRYGITPAAVRPVNSINRVSIFPNPANNQLNIVFNSATSNNEDTYYLLNMAGRIVISGTIEAGHSTIDISQLLSGMYLLQIGENPDNNFRVVVQ